MRVKKYVYTCFCFLVFIFMLNKNGLSQTYTISEGQPEGNIPVEKGSVKDEIEIFKVLVKRFPDNAAYHLQLADLYSSQGMGKECMQHAMKVIELNPGKEPVLQAYQIAVMGAYAIGEMKNSYDFVEAAMKLDPNNENTLNLKMMLEFARDNYWKGQLPQKISWYGFPSTYEFLEAKHVYGVGITGPKGGKDCVITPSDRSICFSEISGWEKEENVLVKNGIRILLNYRKSMTTAMPNVGITVDHPGPDIKSVADYSRKIKSLLEEQQGILVEEPQEVVLNNQNVSQLNLSLDAQFRSTWYQLLIDGQIISIQLMSQPDTYLEDVEQFKMFIESLEVSEPQPASAFRPPSIE